jgi:hypothetical protein
VAAVDTDGRGGEGEGGKPHQFMSEQESSKKSKYRGALRIYCPQCKAVQPCPALPLWKLKKPKARRWFLEDHPDIQWFRRGRECSVCHHKFLTAELDEEFTEDLLELRKLVAVKNQRIIRKIRRTAPWIKNPRNETIPREVAEKLIARSLWWDTHSSGSPVLSSGHARHIRMTPHGWTLEMGANSILLGKAIERCCRIVNSYFDEAARGNLFRHEEVEKKLKSAIRSSVANFEGVEYEGEYSGGVQNEMQFGAHHLDLNDAVRVMVEVSSIKELTVTESDNSD